MADDEDVDDAEENVEEGDSSGKKKLIIFIAIGVVLISISIGGTLFAVKMLSPEPIVEEPVETTELDEEGNLIVEEEEIKKGYAIYFPLKPPIIVNFQARGRQRFLQADITLMTREDDVVDAIETHMPMIRNALVLKFGGQTYEELQTEEGRELLRQESLEELQNIMLQEIEKTGIEKLLFTNFVMQ
ncbi:MAG: flagellar FliL protein [Candidatus Endobugula sp.]|jgi:flagellar FliL protein